MKRLIFLLLILCPGCGGNTPEERSVRNSSPALKTPAGLKFRDMAGKSHDIDSILGQGQSVALVFWQTWCKPCLREMPELARVDRQYSPRIRFYGIVSGADEDVDVGVRMVGGDDMTDFGARKGSAVGPQKRIPAKEAQPKKRGVKRVVKRKKKRK